MKKIKAVVLIFSLPLLLSSFQNCSKLKFADDPASRSLSSTESLENDIFENGNLSNPVPKVASVPPLPCEDNQPIYTAENDPTTNSLVLPEGIDASPFEESLDNVGQDWSISNSIPAEGQIQIWSLDPNAGVIVNGKLARASDGSNILTNSSSLNRVKTDSFGGSCNFYYTGVNVSKGDSIALALVHSVFGGNYRWLIIGINGKKYLWKTATKDYRMDGGHNALGAIKGGTVNGKVKSYKCSGNLVKTMPLSKTYSKGGCIDFSQNNSSIQCAEITDEFNNSSDCRLYDGVAVSGGTDLSFSTLIFTSIAEIK